MNLARLIEQNYHKLSENDLHIWEYIHTHPEECREISIDRLGAACNISHTTIIRFARKLGLKGFSELKFILKWQQGEQEGFGRDELEKVAQDYQQTLEYIKTVDLSDLFEVLEQADKVYVYGSGSVQSLAARNLKHNFFVANKLFRTIEGKDEMTRVISRIGEQDVMILISLSGNNAFVNEVAQQLKKQGNVVVSICRVQTNELILYSDFNIPFFTHEVQTGGELEFWSMAQIFVINEMLILRYLQYVDEKKRRKRQEEMGLPR